LGRAYVSELERLAQTVAFSCEADVKPLAFLLSSVVSRNLIFVGSGGSFTAATFAAALHETYTGRLAKAVTPLEAVTRPTTTNTAAVLLSARGSNPDILQAFRALSFKGPIAAVCATAHNALLREIDSSGCGLGYGFSVPGGKDGFLATNSLIATLVLLIRAYESLLDLPLADLSGIGDEPAWFQKDAPAFLRISALANADTVVALSGGWGWPAAVDLESKFSEAGLASVLLSDYRNFAHGRHNWLRKRGERTAIVSLEDAGTTNLATSMLRLVPTDVRICRLVSEREGPTAGVDLISQELYLTGLVGSAFGVDPGRPPVATFGRRMYRNGFKLRGFPENHHTQVERKAEAIGILPHEDRRFLSEALDRFLERLRGAHIQAVVADYDGTLCDPSERFTGLQEAVSNLLSRLVSEGLILGIATGRGGSAHEVLRKAIPRKHWDNVLLGLYNGAVVLPLTQEPSDSPNDGDSRLAEAYKVLAPLINRLPIKVARNVHQLSLVPIRPLSLARLRRSVMELLDDIVLPNRVRESSHSVDILSGPASKERVVSAVATRIHGHEDSAILRIGDLGDWGGNDFDLLKTGLSLSVDRVSAHLDACWNLGPPGSRGVNTAIRYLQSLKPSPDGFRFDVDSLLRSWGPGR
jgi:fructoselysine-6-P-deglycase FrlB-like protein